MVKHSALMKVFAFLAIQRQRLAEIADALVIVADVAAVKHTLHSFVPIFGNSAYPIEPPLAFSHLLLLLLIVNNNRSGECTVVLVCYVANNKRSLRCFFRIAVSLIRSRSTYANCEIPAGLLRIFCPLTLFR